jgi:branched-chain amino acid transport system substrate-binding protein
MKAWAARVNRGGGLFVKEYGRRLPVRFVVYDDRSDEATAKKYYERLVTVDKVDLLLGPYSSPLTLASSTAAENHKVPYLAVCANSPKIYGRGFQWLAGVIDLGPRYTYRYWEMIKAEGKAKTVSFVVEDTLHPLSVHDGAKKLAEDAGLKVLSSDTVPADTRDFTPLVTRLKALKPDLVFVSSNIPFGVNFMKQARELKLSPKEYHAIHHSGVFQKPLGATAEGVTGQSYWVEGMKLGDSKLIKELLEASDLTEPMYPWVPAYIAAFQIVEAAVEKAGTLEKGALMRTLKGLRIDTVCGQAFFHETGYGSINTYPSQIQNGRYVVIWPRSAATGNHVYPRPEWK